MSDTKPSYSAVTDNTKTKAPSLKTKETPNASTKLFEKKKTKDKEKKPWPTKKQDNNTKKRFQGETVGLEDAIFYYGKDMNSKYVTSKEKLLSFIGKKYTMSESTSIDKETPSLIGIILPKQLKKADFDALEFFEQEEWKLEIKRYSNANALLVKNLSSCYAIIWGQCSNSLKNRIKAHTLYKTTDKTKDSCSLFKIITTICNRVSTIDHVPTSFVESLYSLMDMSGDKMSLSDYYEHFTARRRAASSIGLTFDSTKLKAHMIEAQEKKMEVGSTELADWTLAVETNTDDEIYANIFIKQAGIRFAECRREMYNNYTFGTDQIPVTVDDAYALLQNYEGSAKFIQHQIKQSKKGNQNQENDKTLQSGHSFQQEQGFR